MILISALILTAGLTDRIAETIENPTVHILGFYCADRLCEIAPRPIGGSLAFDPRASAAVLAEAPRSEDRWTFVLNCKVGRDRINDCRLTDWPENGKERRIVALRMARRIRLVDVDRTSPRAIVTIEYDSGPCPAWRCAPTPAPPPSPAG